MSGINRLLSRAVLLLISLLTTFTVSAFTEPSAGKIQITFGAGFSDATAVTAVAGNYHTTLGEQRKEVIRRAALIWSERLDLTEDIYLTADFSGLYCVANGATLGSAGPSSVYFMSNVWYASALARQLPGGDSISAHEDIGINLNSNIDLGCFSYGSPDGWYYGLDYNPSATEQDLLSVVVHEFAHGLGFLSFADAASGTLFNGSQDSYTQNLYDNGTNKAWTAMSNAERQASAIGGNLAWNGSNTNTYAATVLSDGFSNTRTEMYAPNPLESGSSVGHFSTDATPNQVMEPMATEDGVNLDIEPMVMKDIGWSLNADNAQATINVYDVTVNVDINSSVQLTPLAGTSSDVSSGSLYVYEYSQLPTNGDLDDNYSDTPTYSPDSNYTGTDTVKFRVYDDNYNLSEEGVFNIVVSDPGADADPVAVNDSYSFAEDSSVQTLAVLTNDTDDNSIDTSSIVITSAFSGGTVSVSDSNILITPNADVNGSFSFTYTVDDNIGQTSNAATVSITITPENDAPVAVADSASLDEDHSGFTLDLIGNDSDIDSTIDNDSVVIVTNPSNGTLDYSASVFTYTPNNNYFGADSFTYKLNDGALDSNTVTFSLTVNSVNDAPYSITDGFTLNQNTAMDLYILSNDSDVESSVDFSMVEIVSDVSHGTLDLTASILTYTPDNNYFGADQFTYRLNDGEDNGNSVNVDLTITHVNADPIAQNDNFTIDEDTQTIFDVLANDSDDVLIDSITITSQPTNGDLTINNDNSITYDPDLDYFGSDSFTYFVTDDEDSDSSTATVSITIDSVNDLPVANDDSFTISTDSVNLFPLLNDTDEDINSITIHIDTQPTHGTVAISGSNVVYQSTNNYTGLDSFTYYLTDNLNDSSNSALVELDIRSENAPVTNDLSVNVDEDTSNNSIDLISSNSYQNAISEIVIVSDPQYGSVVIDGLNALYTPNANFAGDDSFNYQIKDNQNLLSNVSTLSITVDDINDAPIAMNDTATVTMGSSKTINVLNNDWDEDIAGLTINIISQPSLGVALVESDRIVYTANTQFTQDSDQFSYQLVDSQNEVSNIVVVDMNITLEANPPVAFNDFYSLNSNDTLEFNPTSDDDFYTDFITLNIIQVENGIVSIDGLDVTFEPNSNFVGQTTISYNITDELNQSSNTATITLNVLDENPITIAQEKITLMDTDLSFNAYDNTEASTSAQISIVEFPSKGYLSIDSDEMLYEPYASQSGEDAFAYVLTSNNSSQVKVNVSIELLNEDDYAQRISQQVITLTDDNFTVIEDMNLSLNVLFNDGLIDNDLYEVSITQSSSNGSVSVNNNAVIYSPNENYVGTDYFNYHVTNIASGISSQQATVNLSVTPVNDAPFSDDFSLSTTGTITIDLFSNATDVDGTLTSINIVSPPNSGLLILSGNQATYTKASGFIGSDAFSYTIADDLGAISDVITVSIDIQESGAQSNNSNDTVTIEVSGGAININQLIILFLLLTTILIVRSKVISRAQRQRARINK